MVDVKVQVVILLLTVVVRIPYQPHDVDVVVRELVIGGEHRRKPVVFDLEQLSHSYSVDFVLHRLQLVVHQRNLLLHVSKGVIMPSELVRYTVLFDL